MIEITHYKDFFCRRKQRVGQQRLSPSLILACKKEHLVYPGAPVCQFFDEPYFYYTSCVMNCLYDCEYCYLKGMYPSGHLVIFVNIEDTIAEVEKLLKEHPVYLCISYDTDLLAIENLTGFVREWSAFAQKESSLRIECRTKCARTDLWKKLAPLDSMIFAFTLSPQPVIDAFEHKTPSLQERLHSIREAMEAGFPVRLCFDPMIYIPGWKQFYSELLSQVSSQIPLDLIRDASVGSFRISQDYLKRLRRVLPNSAVVQFPFENVSGVYQYPPSIQSEMEQFLTDHLSSYMEPEKIYLWKS